MLRRSDNAMTNLIQAVEIDSRLHKLLCLFFLRRSNDLLCARDTLAAGQLSYLAPSNLLLVDVHSLQNTGRGRVLCGGGF